MQKTISVLLSVVSLFLSANIWSENCQPTIDVIPVSRALPHSYVDQGLDSLPKIYPKHQLLLQQRDSSIGNVRYSLLVYKEEPNSTVVRIEGAAVRDSNAWTFQTKCSADAVMDGLVTTLERIAVLGNPKTSSQ